MSKEKRDIKQMIREWLPYLAMLAVVILIRVFILINANIPSPSMENTIMTGSRVMGLKCAYWFDEPERGDIIVFHAPDSPDTLYVKRLIGLPGETVELIDGETYVNGEKLTENYLAEADVEDKEYRIFEIPEGCYLMLGDNRNDSLDARYWENTYVTRDAIVGKVYFTYWPPFTWLADSAGY